MKILQIAHGRILPKHNSAYSLRCHRYVQRFKDRNLISIGGLVFRDERESYAWQFRSILMTGFAFLKGNRSFEIYISRARFMRKKYIHQVASLIDQSDVVIFEGPWQFPVFRQYLKGKKIVYDAHNVEYVLRKGNIWENYVRELENDLLSNCDLVITVSEDDRDKIIDLYGLESDKIKAIPEGYITSPLDWKGAESDSIIFIGSAYEPNVRAAELVLKTAESLPQLHFNIMGSVCSVLRRTKVPKNVTLLGMVDESTKYQVLSNSVLALNPVTIGSGRNVKMIDYVSSGVPVVTTEVGARGFESIIKNKFYITDTDKLTDTIKRAISDRADLKSISNFYIEYAKNNGYEVTEKMTYESISRLLDVN